jgi:hypothetical protein
VFKPNLKNHLKTYRFDHVAGTGNLNCDCQIVAFKQMCAPMEPFEASESWIDDPANAAGISVAATFVFCALLFTVIALFWMRRKPADARSPANKDKMAVPTGNGVQMAATAPSADEKVSKTPLSPKGTAMSDDNVGEDQV